MPTTINDLGIDGMSMEPFYNDPSFGSTKKTTKKKEVPSRGAFQLPMLAPKVVAPATSSTVPFLQMTRVSFAQKLYAMIESIAHSDPDLMGWTEDGLYFYINRAREFLVSDKIRPYFSRKFTR